MLYTMSITFTKSTLTEVHPTTGTPNQAIKTAAGTSKDVPTSEPNSAVERTQQLSSYVDNQETLQDTRAKSLTLPTITALRQRDDLNTKINNVAARPVFIGNVVWQASHALGDIITNLSVPRDVLGASVIKQQKLARFQFFSADVVMRVTASAMAFQAGRLWLSFEAASHPRGARQSSASVIAATSLDGLEFDPTVPTPMEFRVPYFAPMSEWNTIGEFGLGALKVTVISPLNSASTASDVSLSVQAWLENVTFGVPTQAPINLGVAPMANMVKAFRQSHKEKAQAENTHRVSDTLDTVSEIAGAIGEIPMLSAIARPVSWGTSLAARAARMFGFSKPDVSCAPTRVEIFPQSTASYMDGSSDAVLLSATSNFEIPTGPVFGTDIDEMDIAYVCSRMCNLAAYNWDTTFTPGSVLFSMPVMPGLSQPTGAAGSVSYNHYQPTPMAFVASMFKYWAGAIKFRFEAVSTPFHAGRLLIAYVPNYDPLGAFNVTEVGSNYNIVWDITTSNHVEFEVPYMSNVPYLETFIDGPDIPYLMNGEIIGPNVRNRLRRVSNGAIVVFVLESLVAPSTASNTIQILPWLGGGRDITFAEPTLSEFCVSPGRHNFDMAGRYYDGTVMVQPATTAPVRLREPISLDEHEEFEVVEDRPIRQSLRNIRSVSGSGSSSVPLPTTGVDENMKGSSQNDFNFESWMPAQYMSPMDRAQLVTGECITNLRLLTRRMCPVYTIMPLDATNAGALAHTPPTSGQVLCIDLDYFSSRVRQGDDAIYDRPFGSVAIGGNKWMYELPSFLSYISYLYTYVRGTRRFLITSRPSAVINGATFAEGTQRFPDSTDDRAHAPTGEFDVRMSAIVSNEQYVYHPWFRPEESLIAYNYANESFATIGENYTYGLGALASSDSYVKRIGSNGTSLEVSASAATPYPIRLLADPTLQPTEYNSSVRGDIPRKRRFLEIRYRPQTTATRGVTSNFAPTFWPIPTTISEAGGDDLSFGYLQNPPRITRIAKVHLFAQSDGNMLRL